jgi:hypothetical protein
MLGMAQKSREERLKALLEEKAEIDARINRLRSQDVAQKRKLETRMKIILGAAVMLERNDDPTFDQRVQAVIEKRVRTPRDRAVFGLPPLEPGP